MIGQLLLFLFPVDPFDPDNSATLQIAIKNIHKNQSYTFLRTVIQPEKNGFPRFHLEFFFFRESITRTLLTQPCSEKTVIINHDCCYGGPILRIVVNDLNG